MILVTGDTHGNINFDKIERLVNLDILTKDDYLIIAGDFGGIWFPRTWNQDIQKYADLPFTILFVDGNHENFDIINSFPISIWNGGKVHIIKDNIIHLMRGQIYNLENKKIFTFGGAISIDKYLRQEHISWWKEELPNEEEILEAKNNLAFYHNEVDYIITHTTSSEALNNPSLCSNGNKCKVLEDNLLLDWFEENIKYKHWYFGHYHTDIEINDKKTCLYYGFEELK